MTPLRSLPGRPAHAFVKPWYAYQLEMVRPSLDRVHVPPMPEGYDLRQFRPGDETAYEDLFHLAFEDESRLTETIERALEDGFFVVEHVASGELVASCVAMRGGSRPSDPSAGCLGWLVADPSHASRGLGTIVAAVVTNRLAAEGYRRPYLKTDDFRLAAILIYLKFGWRPFLYREDMESRWRAIFTSLGREFRREDCEMR
ncbi:MAG: GNAT family N-acetyltransferase [Dehalococcoidia bacterium]